MHRSGVANHGDDLVEQLAQTRSARDFIALLQKRWSAPELVALALAHGSQAEPGTRFVYSDTNYVLIGMVIEAATGKRWERVLSERVLEPLALRDTSAPGADPSIAGAYMHGYAQLPFAADYRDVTALSPSSLDAAASLVSTPADVNRFFSALLGGELLSEPALREMTRMRPVSDETGASSYGLGLAFTLLACGGGYYGHPGDTLGFHTRNAVDADGTRSVCIAISGDGEFEARSTALIEHALCPRN